MSLALNSQLGPYVIVAPLGAGGMGEVYRARDTRLDREVAIKVLPERTARDEQALSRFRRETKALAALSHPNILMILDVGEHEGVSYAVMELLEGETLRQRLQGTGVDPRRALEIAAAVADGLAAAHAREIVHRDLKPENLFLTRDGVVKILDFGLARTGLNTEPSAATVTAATQPGVVLGTVNYMAPEQVRGQQADARCDIFSLGCVLYEMLTGHPPFARETSAETMAAILRHHPSLASEGGGHVPPDIEPILAKCLEKSPNERFHSAHDLAFALRSASLRAGERGRVPRKTARLRGLVAVVAMAAVAVGLLYVTVGRQKPRVDPIDSIAVLPFVNASGDPEQEYFVDGMTEALIADLAKIRALKVISRTSAMQYKGAKKPLPDIARELKVEAVVEGSVLRVGERVRITAQLIHAATDEHLWAESYEHDFRDVLRLHSELARTIAQEIKVTLTPQEQARLAAARPVNPAAQEAYMRGRFHWHTRTPTGMRNAIQYFSRAIELDPQYAPAYAGMADAHTHSARHGQVSPKEAFPLAKQAALKAAELDHGSAEAHGALAAIALYFDWDWTVAERELIRALDLNPSYEEAHHQYSHLLLTVGRPNESLTESKRALELNPLDPSLKFHLGWHYMMTRQYDQGIAQLKSVLDMDPHLYQALRHIGWAYTYNSLHAEAITAFVAATKSEPDNAQAMAALAAAYAAGGQGSDARALLRKLESSLPQRFVSACDIAAAYAALKEVDLAIEWLEKAYEERSPRMVELGLDPIFDPLRTDPRFADLVRRVGLPPLPAPRGADSRAPTLDKGGQRGVASDKIMLAVLPFENLSRDPEQEYFSDGLTEEMIAQLGRVNPQKLGVIARTSAMHYKNTDRAIERVRRELGVGYIVEGSVRRADNRVRITARLIQCTDQSQVWANSFERELKDILALQSDVAHAIAQEVRVTLAPQGQAQIAANRPVNPEAYQAYLKGRFYWNKRTADGLEKAVEYFEQAVSLEPNWPLGCAGLADAYALMPNYASVRTSEAMPKARAAAAKALELDESLGEAHAAMALIATTYDWNWSVAEREHKRALALSPNYATAHHWYALYLMITGQREEALKEITKARELDPLSFIISSVGGAAHYYAGDFAQSETQLRKTLELGPDFAYAHAYLAKTLFLQRKFVEATTEAREAVRLANNDPFYAAILGYVCAKGDQPEEGRRILRELAARSMEAYVAPSHFALVHAGLGEEDRMFDWLERAYQERDVNLLYALIDPLLAPMNSDPRFVDLVRRVGLPKMRHQQVPVARPDGKAAAGGSP